MQARLAAAQHGQRRDLRDGLHPDDDREQHVDDRVRVKKLPAAGDQAHHRSASREDITSRSLPVRARVNILMTPPTRFQQPTYAWAGRQSLTEPG
jgi:hypothetical protein